MLGTFFPWKARTLEANPDMFAALSAEGMGRCRFSCCLSFVVVIFVKSPATISIISVIGIELISYFGGGSLCVRRLSDSPLRERKSSFAKLCICARSRTLIVVPPYRERSSDDHADLEMGLGAGGAGDAKCGVTRGAECGCCGPSG